MKLFEYQAKELFQQAGIPVPKSILIFSEQPYENILDDFSYPCVLKSQVLQGKRGKSGLIRFAKTAQEAKKHAEELFSCNAGVKRILLEEAVEIQEEIYLSITMDPFCAKALVMSCREGGMDIEDLAISCPEKIHRQLIDLDYGMMDFQARSIAYELGLEGVVAKQFALVVSKLYQIFRKNDAELVEINPLFLTKQGSLMAGDGKLTIDENSLFRQKSYEIGRDYFESDAEYEAHQEGIPYLQFNGDISLMCAGAGLTTTVYDLINYAGGTVANYLEFGGANYKKAIRAMELCLESGNPKVILIVTFGTIARADVMAEGIKEAIEKLHPSIPIVACIRGTNEETAVEILRSCGLDPLFDTEEAVERAVALAKEAKA